MLKSINTIVLFIVNKDNHIFQSHWLIVLFLFFLLLVFVSYLCIWQNIFFSEFCTYLYLHPLNFFTLSIFYFCYVIFYPYYFYYPIRCQFCCQWRSNASRLLCRKLHGLFVHLIGSLDFYDSSGHPWWKLCSSFIFLPRRNESSHCKHEGAFGFSLCRPAQFLLWFWKWSSSSNILQQLRCGLEDPHLHKRYVV